MSTGRTGQCIATHPRPPQLLAPCHPTQHGPRQRVGHVKKCSPKAASLWPLLAHIWPEIDQKWPENGHVSGRFRIGPQKTAHPGGQSAAWPKSGPEMGRFWSRCVRNRIRPFSGAKTGPFPAQKGPKNGRNHSGSGPLAQIWSQRGQNWLIFWPEGLRAHPANGPTSGCSSKWTSEHVLS